MKCYFHENDLDGRCSGAIIKRFHPECEMIPMNYWDKIHWDNIKPDEKIYMVDFALQPYEEMERFRGMNFVWIDHHKTAIDALPECKDYPGIRVVGQAACELTWIHLLNGVPMPAFIKLLGQYDIWDHRNPNVLPFQFGLRMVKDTMPEGEIWDKLFQDCGEELTHFYIVKGQTILEYLISENEAYCHTYSFLTTLDGYRAIAINKGKTNSQIFDSVWDLTKYDIMLTFCRLPLPKRLWTISIYSVKGNIDCGLIAKAYGGGGHKGAASFRCAELPFDI